VDIVEPGASSRIGTNSFVVRQSSFGSESLKE